MKTYLFYIIGIFGLIICLALSIQAHLLWPSIALGVMLIWLFVSLYGRISRLRYAYHETEKENQKLHGKIAEAERQLQYLRQLTENVDTALFVCSTDGRIDWMNHAAEKTLSPTLPLYGEGVLPENILRAIAEHKEVVDGCALSTVLLRIDGQRKLVVALKDVSMLMQRQEMEAWQQLIRVLTHEIMNSLTPIISITETLAPLLSPEGDTFVSTNESKDSPSGDVRGAFAVINRRCHSLLDFVESYRQLTRIKTPEKTTFPVSELFEHLKALFSLTPSPNTVESGEKNTPQLTFSPLPGANGVFRVATKCGCGPTEGREFPLSTVFGLEVRLLADRAQIEQVLINLIKNAYESGATEVEVSAQPLPSPTKFPSPTGEGLGERPEGSGVRLFVRDNGAGMSPDVLEHAFIPFYTTKTTGTGIGLSLCRQIILKHGGTIHIESEEKKGTTIEIKI